MPRRGSDAFDPHDGEPPAGRARTPSRLSARTLAPSLDELIAQRRLPTGTPPRSEVHRSAAGDALAHRRGRGLEADERRAYLPGDDPRHIDWKTSARLGTPHTRLYREERDQTLSVVLDLRDTLFTGSRQLRARRAALQAARRIWQAADRGGRVALVVFDADGPHATMSARSERGALAACSLIHARFTARLDTVAAMIVADAAASPGTTLPPGVAPPLSVLVDRLIAHGRGLGSVALITAFDDVSLDPTAAPALERELRRLCLAAPVSVVLVSDELERQAIPSGSYRYLSTGGSRHTRVDRRTGATVPESLRAERRALDTLCRRSGASVEHLHDADSAQDGTV